ncbi:tRNA (adenosine(37)-N6)-dimethylallyltransferase MiaA [Blastomonas fulva]|uniref:tRNA (adenosine(37)-N6)-dimethylallyltransferase MiaA n=1 Tax=Blastomonas fulva TaxID=1550728 RepID=UPI0025A452A0|nr:tRNA (adenosine(37)-N6)-dimethylallyltransferase MiaA [Blastomonas fulva]MDM7966046.1 tRNA (adenosine(37)-N6)-dimethylallyltransferase MiaA [Blastomonas fulva]
MGTITSPDRTGNTRPAVALIAGPTASGKSGLAVCYAHWLEKHGQRAVIVNADSAQVYADLAVLSARPSAGEMGGIDHRLFGYIDGAEACSAARWAADARAEIAAAHLAGALPILVGGTGLYIQTLLHGIAPIPPIDPAIREAVRAMPVDQTYVALKLEDAASAARLNAADTTRVARALEIIRSTGQPIAHWQARKEGGIAERITLHPLVLRPPRDWLLERCDRRFAAMLDAGALAEVETLLTRHLSPDLPVMRAIGVPEVARLLRGEIDRAQCLAQGQLATRQYAKRQYTWFRNQPPADWKVLEEPLSDSFDVYFDILF